MYYTSTKGIRIMVFVLTQALYILTIFTGKNKILAALFLVGAAALLVLEGLHVAKLLRGEKDE